MTTPHQLTHDPSSRRASEIGDIPRRRMINRQRSHFTLKRGAHRHEENLFLSEQFAEWLTTTTEIEVNSREAFCESLRDGVVLCRIAKQIEGSGLKRFHDAPVPNEFKRRENIVVFQESCARLGLPFVLRVDHIIKGKLDPVISCLLGLAKVVSVQEGFTLPEPIMEKLAAMEALELDLAAKEALKKKESGEETPPSYAASRGISMLDAQMDGWVQRTPSSWLAGSWMEFGIRVKKLALESDVTKRRADSGENEEDATDMEAWTVYRRYTDFVNFATMLVKLADDAGPDKLPPKTFSFHLTGSFLEGGNEALSERMDGLNAYLQIIVARLPSEESDKGYSSAVTRAAKATSEDDISSHDVKVLALVRKFLGVEGSW